MNKQPFYVGQRVVAIEDSHPLFFYAYKKGQEEVVEDIRFNFYGTHLHDFRSVKSGDCWMDCRKWIPIERTRITYVVKEVEVAPEIREKAKETVLQSTQTN